MRVKFTHPAIASGRKQDGSPRAELCRVESEFEVPEYSWDDAPVALVTSEGSSHSNYYHLLDGKLYIAFPGQQDTDPFAVGSDLHYVLHNGSASYVHFDPFHATVSHAAAKMEGESGLRANIKRELLKREHKMGMHEVTKACLNAPMLRKRNWLSRDAEQDIEHWRSIAADKVGNVVLINGVPCLRAFEPCYALNTNFGAPKVRVASKNVFAKQVHVTEMRADGLEILGEDATLYNRHYFAASDYEGAVSFADALGWRVPPSERLSILIRDDAAVNDDFAVLDTVRHARLLLTAMETKHFQYEVRSNADSNTEFASKLAKLLIGAEALKEELISWQTRKDKVGGLRREFASLTEDALDCSDCGRRRPGSHSPSLLAVPHGRGPSWDIENQLRHFLVRIDQAEINLDIPMARNLEL